MASREPYTIGLTPVGPDPNTALSGETPTPHVEKDTGVIRKFGTGATRDTATNKLDYEGFLCPRVLKRYAEYMNKCRHQSDGTLRASDNWQKGIPVVVYMKSKWRHFMDTWFHMRRLNPKVDLEDTLCAELFNTMGLLHEVLKAKEEGKAVGHLIEAYLAALAAEEADKFKAAIDTQPSLDKIQSGMKSLIEQPPVQVIPAITLQDVAEQARIAEKRSICSGCWHASVCAGDLKFSALVSGICSSKVIG